MSSDRVVHTVVIPSNAVAVGDLIELLRALPDSERRALSDELRALELQTADQLDAVAYVAEVEDGFVARSIPVDILASLRWDRLVGERTSGEFELIELRWRLDVIGIAAQAIADLESA